MADRESTAVGYRLRMQPADLSMYPDAVKLQWFQWVVDLGLDRKLKELRKGQDKNGDIHRLAPRTIKYRRSEVGPVHQRAPRGIPALDVSRVMSLLTGRAHTTSAEFWWGFDSVTGASFAVILHYWADDQGHDVFGLSPAGTAWVTAEAMKKWAAWKDANPRGAVANVPGAKAVPRIAVRQPIRTAPIPGRMDLANMDLAGGEPQIQAAMATGRFTGFRRMNTRGEQWKPGHQLGKVLAPKPPPAPGPVSPASTRMTPAARVQELSQYTTSTFGIPSHVLDVEKFTAQFQGAAIDKARAAYDPKTQTIYWNLNSPAWTDTKKHFETQRKEKFLVDPSPVGVAHHEVGHARLHAELIRRYGLEEGTRRYWMLARDEFKDENEFKQRLKKVASRLAAIDKNEFVAEIYSGLVIGRTYPAEVLALYDALGGVRP